jgi:NAD-dependent dihydropyrimidine dehydrogenase PreA subunit
MMQKLPVVDERRCVTSGDCVLVCPTACLELREGLPVLARPHACISCDLCSAVCPTEAIQLVDQWVG